MQRIWAGIEGGGTKFNCLVGRGPDDVLAACTIPTAGPEETLEAAARFVADNLAGHTLAGLGVASFGPIDLDPASPTYGAITTTPKPGWSGVNVVDFFRRRFGVPLGWDTDVNGAALAEQRWGAGRGLRIVVYFTVGTGIGGGAVVDGRALHGLTHPEMGHLPILPASDDGPPGVCPYHGNRCLEGVASGPALVQRAGRPPAELAPEDPLWEEEARYLGFVAAVATLMLSPQRIIFGGGVLRQAHLHPRIRRHCLALLNGYIAHPALTRDADTYIVPPLLGERAGALGALALALDAAPDTPADR
jgi:fructokinase